MGTNELPTSPNSFIAHFDVTSSALYASAPNHVFGQELGCPALVLTTLRSALSARVERENYYDCVLVYPDEHLSRESQKLTVMMR